MRDLDLSLVIVVASAAIIGFALTLDGFEILYDDYDAVLSNENVRPQTPLSRLLVTDFWGSDINSNRSNTQWRPLTTLSYRLDFIIYGCGSAPFKSTAVCIRGFHLTNVLLNASVAALTFLVSLRVFSLSRLVSVALAIMFALHPVHIESVATLYGRADMLCAFFMLCSNLRATKAVQNGDRSKFMRCFDVCLAFVWALCAALSKEVGVAVAMLVPVVMWLVRGRRPSAFVFVIGVVLTLSLVAVRKMLLSSWLPPFGPIDNPFAFTKPWSLQRILSYGYLHARYLMFLILPFNCSPNYGYDSIPFVNDLNDPRNIATVIAYAFVFGGLLFSLLKRSWHVLVLIIWGVAFFVPSSNIFFPVGTAFADRLLYMPSVPFMILAGYLLERIASLLIKKYSSGSLTKVVMCVPFLFLVGSILQKEVQTVHERLPKWRNARLLWEDVVAQFPRNQVALNNAAVEYVKVGNVTEALITHKALLNVRKNDQWKMTRKESSIESSETYVKTLQFTVALSAQLLQMSQEDIVVLANDIIGFYNSKSKDDSFTVHIGNETITLNSALANQALWTILNTGCMTSSINEDFVIDALMYDPSGPISPLSARTLYNLLVHRVIPRRKPFHASAEKPVALASSIEKLLDGFL